MRCNLLKLSFENLVDQILLERIGKVGLGHLVDKGVLEGLGELVCSASAASRGVNTFPGLEEIAGAWVGVVVVEGDADGGEQIEQAGKGRCARGELLGEAS